MSKPLIVLIATVALAFDVGLVAALTITSSTKDSMAGPCSETFGLTQKAQALPDQNYLTHCSLAPTDVRSHDGPEAQKC